LEISRDAAGRRCVVYSLEARGVAKSRECAVLVCLPTGGSGKGWWAVSAGTAISGRENLECAAPPSRCLSMHSQYVCGPSLESVSWKAWVWCQWGSTVWHAARRVVFQVSRPHATTSCPCTLGPAVAVAAVAGPSAMVRLLVLPDCGTIWEGRGRPGAIHCSIYVYMWQAGWV